MNTATYRGMARNAEQRLDWATAAKFWGLAITKYPNKGALAEADIAKMRDRETACKASAAQP